MTNFDPYGESPDKDGPGRMFWIAAAFLVVVILIGAAVIVFGGRDDSEADSTPSSSSSSTDDDSPATEQSGCAEFPDSPDTASTAGSEWVSAGPITFPVSSVSGPADTKSAAYGTCFAATEDGAVYAAATAASIQGLPETDRAAWSQENFIGPAADQATDAVVEGLPADAPALRVAGFRISESTPDRVSVDLLVTSEGAPIRSLFDMRLVDGDWVVYATEENIPSYPVDDETEESFTQW